jgi:hypothetical protein
MRPQLTLDERNLFVELCQFVLEAKTLLVDDYPEPFSYFKTEDWERCQSVIYKLDALGPIEPR